MLFSVSLASVASAPPSSDAGGIAWQAHDSAAFKQAARQGRYILLDMEAVWCHWCHVMDATTYQDPQVTALIASGFVAVKADHDARPDLAERYRDWGWPATIILAPDGTEIVKRAGYISPQDMLALLQAVLDDPSPEGRAVAYPAKIADSALISEAVSAALRGRHLDSYDADLGGLSIGQKFLEADAVAWDMKLARAGDEVAAMRARKSLDAALQLIDPAFGGAYQYSTHFDWQHPHYEKIMRT